MQNWRESRYFGDNQFIYKRNSIGNTQNTSFAGINPCLDGSDGGSTQSCLPLKSRLDSSLDRPAGAQCSNRRGSSSVAATPPGLLSKWYPPYLPLRPLRSSHDARSGRNVRRGKCHPTPRVDSQAYLSAMPTEPMSADASNAVILESSTGRHISLGRQCSDDPCGGCGDGAGIRLFGVA